MARRTSNDYTLGQALRQFLDDSALSEQALIHQVISHWPQVVGKPLADQTESIYFKDGKFVLSVRSPLWRQELLLTKTQLLARIHEYAGQTLADDIIIR